MKTFTTSEQLAEIVSQITALGYRLLGQVTILSTECEYFIPAKEARVNCLMFDIPGRAAIIRFYNNEHISENGHFASYWSFEADMDYGVYNELLTKIPFELPPLDSDRWMHQEVDAYLGEIKDPISPGLNWRSYCQLQYGYAGDIARNQELGYIPAEHIASVAKTVLTRLVPLTAEKFKELSIHWEPGYTFSGLSIPYDNANKRSVKAVLTKLFWERVSFENRRNIIHKVTSPVTKEELYNV